MWEQQREFMDLLRKERNFPDFPVDITSKSGQQFLDGIAFHLMKEMFEFGLHLKNAKQHRLTEIRDVDREACKEELCDVLHLFFEICIGAGFSMDEIYAMYMAKGEINVRRITQGY